MEKLPDNIEQASSDRNINIQKIIDRGAAPLTQYEYDLIVEKLDNLGVKILNESGEVVKVSNYGREASDLISVIRNSEIIPEPPANYPKVTIGSIVTIGFIEDDDIDTFIITGYLKENTDTINTISIESNLGKALFGDEEGCETSYILTDETGNKITKHVFVSKIKQTA